MYVYNIYITIIPWVIIYYYFILLLKLFQLRSLGALSVASILFKKSLTFYIKRWSRLISYISISCPSTRLSQKESGSFSWEMALETMMWVLGVLVTTGVPFLLGPLIWHSRKYMCVYKPMYILLSTYISLCNHVYHIKLLMSSYGCLLTLRNPLPPISFWLSPFAYL